MPRSLEAKSAYLFTWSFHEDRKEVNFGAWEGGYACWYVPAEKELMILRTQEADPAAGMKGTVVKYDTVPYLKREQLWWWRKEMDDMRSFIRQNGL